ncbi:SbmA/BacA-like family transporter [Neisseria chenwenguii]|nr:SbmA/BacA-like family transporter [Neisseria chenwenguii]
MTILKQFKWFLKDYWWRKDNMLSWLVLTVLVALGFGVVEINVRINEWSKSFYDTLEAFQADKLYVLIQEYLVYVAIFVVAAVYRSWLRKLLIIRWRSHLTERLLGDWLQKRAFYRIALKQTTDNPDQRIAEDVNIFVSRTIELFISLLTNLVQLYSFIAILWELSGTHTFNIMGHDITITGYLVWIACDGAPFSLILSQTARISCSDISDNRLRPKSLPMYRLKISCRKVRVLSAKSAWSMYRTNQDSNVSPVRATRIP